MWPLADADALARLGETGSRLKKAGRAGLEGFADGVALMRRLIRKRRRRDRPVEAQR